MKKILYILFTATMFIACQKEDENGDLGAFWKVMSVEEHSTDNVAYLTDESRFWAIQLDLLEIRISRKESCFFRFQHTGDSLMVQAINNENVDLKLWGIYNNSNERYAVELLNSKSMILNSKNARVTFRKF